MYTVTVTIDHDVPALKKLFMAEEKVFNRSSYTLTTRGGKLYCTITAADATAFKVATSTLTKIFMIWEKTHAIGA